MNGVIRWGDSSPNRLVTDKNLPHRQGSSLLDALDFRDGDTWHARVWARELDAAKRHSRGRMLDLAHNLPLVLAEPHCVFQGVRDEGELEWLCYGGHPDFSYTRDGSRRRARENQVFLVFLTHER